MNISGATVLNSTLNLSQTLASGNALRIAGGSSAATTNALSIGGYGMISVDAPGVSHGRLLFDDSGNLTLGSGTLYVNGTTILNNATIIIKCKFKFKNIQWSCKCYQNYSICSTKIIICKMAV